MHTCKSCTTRHYTALHSITEHNLTLHFILLPYITSHTCGPVAGLCVSWWARGLVAGPWCGGPVGPWLARDEPGFVAGPWRARGRPVLARGSRGSLAWSLNKPPRGNQRERSILAFSVSYTSDTCHVNHANPMLGPGRPRLNEMRRPIFSGQEQKRNGAKGYLSRALLLEALVYFLARLVPQERCNRRTVKIEWVKTPLSVNGMLNGYDT